MPGLRQRARAAEVRRIPAEVRRLRISARTRNDWRMQVARRLTSIDFSAAHELVLNMRALWEIVKDDPIGRVVHRLWYIGGRTYHSKPTTLGEPEDAD